MSGNIDASLYTFQERDIIHVRCGRHRTERVVPPAGEEYAFDVERWDHRVEVSVSPTGRSVQVYVDGEKVYP